MGRRTTLTKPCIGSLHATAQMDNITSLEICELRPFFSTAFNHLKTIESNAVRAAAAEAGQNTSSSIRGDFGQDSMEA